MAAVAGSGAAAAPSSLLLVVGSEFGSPGLLTYVLEELERGIRSWDVDPGVCNLDEQLKVFVSRHSATFSSIVKGQRSLHHRGDNLETLVLLNPSDKSLCDELRNLLLDPASHKLLVLAGPCLEETGELLLQTGGFSPHHFLQVLKDREIRDILATTPPPVQLPILTITCPTFGDWAQLAPAVPGLQGALRLQLRLNPPAQLPNSEGLCEFLEYVAESLEPPSPFELLEPPTSGGFLRLGRPCCYIFPGGLGDAAFFAVNGFTVLVNGGSNPKSSFWKLVRHLDRVDAVLVTHPGADSLPGLNSLLRRKLAERSEVAAGGGSWDNRLRRLISPNLGVVFFNACEAASRLARGEDEAELALSLLAQLGITPLPLSRGPVPAKPTVLFEKMGVGRLDMYVLHPPSAGAERTLASVCALLVWHPAGPGEKVVRVLFPGCTPPACLLDGLVRLQHLRFLREPVVTPQDLEGPGRAESKESVGSRDSSKREGLLATHPRPGQERPGVARKEPARAEAPRKTEKEARTPRELKKDPKPSVSRTQPREVRRAASSVPNLKKTSAQAAPKPRKAPSTAPSTSHSGFPPVANGPRSPPSLRCGEASPPSAACGSPASQLVATPSLELGPIPAGEKALELPLAASSIPRPRTPSPESHRSPAEGSERLSLSPLRGGEAGPDASPTVTTPTVTTPSLPAEVGSPHSTEVDESLSVSFEQVLPPSAPTSEAGLSLPLRGPRARRSASPHDVDLCLVSPCEFEHRKAVPMAPAPASPGSSNDSSARSQERAGGLGAEETPPTSVSESLPTLSDSDPVPLAPGAADSDDDTEGFGVPRHDPLPDPLKVPPPLPDPSSICMVDPEMLPPKTARQTENVSRTRKPLARPNSRAATPKATPVAAAKTKGLAGGDRASRPLSARSEPSEKGGRAPLSRKSSTPKTATRGPSGSASSRPGVSATPPKSPVYLDLAYLPSGSSAHLVDEEFFQRVRALCYVISGQDQRKEEGMRAVLDALLASKQHWDRDLQVTLIPTFDSVAMHTWYAETHTRHQALGITVLGSNSMVSMQDDAFPACKVEF
ncbi:microtubule-associated protein 1S isoform X2 [Gorilla gorilla gorilla]|uniref:microtubule-associated protein 1S isoform X1 n=1 Tax=Gorilla gorilla gorilla TaxID=9595 RepID=UPI0024462398|nr:microtubule-associated protein 1S isoform X1 [Gorilla gorilla gorilla]XP_055228089.1 microtubule-associated protein 1S isoform X2 [Gorilla gorilla gorilla]